MTTTIRFCPVCKAQGFVDGDPCATCYGVGFVCNGDRVDVVMSLPTSDRASRIAFFSGLLTAAIAGEKANRFDCLVDRNAPIGYPTVQLAVVAFRDNIRHVFNCLAREAARVGWDRDIIVRFCEATARYSSHGRIDKDIPVYEWELDLPSFEAPKPVAPKTKRCPRCKGSGVYVSRCHWYHKDDPRSKGVRCFPCKGSGKVDVNYRGH